jgi:hypothetical protein
MWPRVPKGGPIPRRTGRPQEELQLQLQLQVEGQLGRSPYEQCRRCRGTFGTLHGWSCAGGPLAPTPLQSNQKCVESPEQQYSYLTLRSSGCLHEAPQSIQPQFQWTRGALCYKLQGCGSRPDEVNKYFQFTFTLWRWRVLPVRYELDCKYCYKQPVSRS